MKMMTTMIRIMIIIKAITMIVTIMMIVVVITIVIIIKTNIIIITIKVIAIIIIFTEMTHPPLFSIFGSSLQCHRTSTYALPNYLLSQHPYVR